MKPTHGQLIFQSGNISQVVAENLPFALLQAKKTQIKNAPQYSGGKLIIKYFIKK